MSFLLHNYNNRQPKAFKANQGDSGRKIAKKGHFAPTPCVKLFFLKCREFCGESTVKTLPKNFHGKIIKTEF